MTAPNTVSGGFDHDYDVAEKLSDGRGPLSVILPSQKWRWTRTNETKEEAKQQKRLWFHFLGGRFGRSSSLWADDLGWKWVILTESLWITEL
jgi:hypothetical protein